MTDYAQMDADLDEELRAIYAQRNESEGKASDSPEQSGTESTEEIESNAAAQDGETGTDDSQTEAVASAELNTEATELSDTESSEGMVSEARYKEAVKAMNRSQREAAEYRKTEAQRDDLIQQLQAQIAELRQAQPDNSASAQGGIESASDSTPAQVDDDDLKEAREYYPEVVNPLLKIIDRLEQELAGMKGEFGDVKHVAERYQQETQKIAEQQQVEAILSAHPDASEIAASPEYANWFEVQSPMVKAALTEGGSKDVIAALNMFKAEHPNLTQASPVSVRPKADKLAAAKQAAAPNVRGTAKPGASKSAFTLAQIDKMSLEEFKQHETAIDKALANGEIA